MDNPKLTDGGEFTASLVPVRTDDGTLKGYLRFESPVSLKGEAISKVIQADPDFDPAHADVSAADRAAALVHYTYALAWFDHGAGMLECCVRYAEGMERHCFWRDAFPARALKGAGTYRVY